MTQQAETTSNKKPAQAAKVDESASPKPGDEEYTQLILDRASLKFEPFTKKDEDKPTESIYIGAPVDGYVNGVAAFTMTDDDTGEIRECLAYIIELTRLDPKKPLMVFDRGSDKPRPATLGEEVRLNQTAVLRQNLPSEVANHPTKRLEVRILPLRLMPHPKKPKLKLWRYEVGTYGISDRPKGKIDHVALMLASAEKAVEQLAGG